MTRTQKTQVVENISAEFDKAQAVVVCNYSTMTVQNLETLRSSVRAVDGKVQVVKNTLAKLAFEKAGTKDVELSGTNIYIWSGEQISISKAVCDFGKAHESFTIKAAVVEKEIVESAQIEALSKLPSRDELIGMLLSVWTAPARNFVTGLDNLRTKKEEEA